MKKFFTLIIACIAAIAATAQTEGATTTWGLTGEGTEANPYCIYTADDLYAMAKNCNADHKGTGEYFVLKNDIYFDGTAETPKQLPAIGKDGNAQITKIALASTAPSTELATPSAASTTPRRATTLQENITPSLAASTKTAWSRTS